MALTHRTCSTIVKLHQRGKGLGYIAKLLHLSKSSVQGVVQRYKATGSSQTRTHNPTPAVRTPALIRQVAAVIAKDPKQTIKGLARRFGIARNTMRTLIKKDLGLKSLRLKKVHHIPPGRVQERLDRVKKLRTRLRRCGYDRCVWTDEKIFRCNQALNPQNQRILAPSVAQAPAAHRLVPQLQHSQGVMVFGGVCSFGKTPLLFVPEGVKVNQNNYQQDILRPTIRHLRKHVFPNDQHFVFQQDGAPAHKAKSTQNWLRNRRVDFVSESQWPPYSPDLNVMDFCIWGILESRVNSKRHSSINGLKRAIRKAWNELDMQIISDACAAVETRFGLVIAAGGGNIE